MTDSCWRYGKDGPQLKPHSWRAYQTQTSWDWERCVHCGHMRNVTPR